MRPRPAIDFLTKKQRKNDESSESEDEEETRKGKGTATTAVPRNFRVRPDQAQNEMESADLFVIDNEAEGEAETCANEKEKEESGSADAGMSTSSARSGRRYREGDQRIQQILKKAVGGAAFEKTPCQTARLKGQRTEKRERMVGDRKLKEMNEPLQKELEKTTGKSWFDMPATELTDERKMDLQILQMRNAIDPLAHYRKPDRTALPKYFQFGKIVDSPVDFYSSRVPKKQRKKSIVDELLDDDKLHGKMKQR
ncbi:hypothetical protein WR25_00358 [Diploscapter pachys]|uniref:Fcf2 pre-rRNA processing C-terminal domain-containing protein n=1 Tax=Diploscapter pachys TaxID=2018661 RepID=A0A2A2JZ85_9BILA|nr:hypothetical protein WR25_00358 [Diploscapter pachys]